MTAKPTVSGLGIDPVAQAWQRSGQGNGAIEIAFVRTGDTPRRTPESPDRTPDSADRAAGSARHGQDSPGAAQWVLMRVAGDPDQRVLVFDRHEWECFLDGARNGEFDDAADHDPDLLG